MSRLIVAALALLASACVPTPTDPEPCVDGALGCWTDTECQGDLVLSPVGSCVESADLLEQCGVYADMISDSIPGPRYMGASLCLTSCVPEDPDTCTAAATGLGVDQTCVTLDTVSACGHRLLPEYE